MRRIIVIFILLVFSQTGFSQVWKLQRIEAFGGLSTYHYFGDIGGSADKSNLGGLKDINFKSIRPGFNFGGIFRLEERFYIKGYLSFGVLYQTDEGSKNEHRHLAFSTIANEFSLQGMYFIIPESNQNYYYSVMQMRGGLNRLNKPFSLYTFFGVGSLFYDVKPKDNLIGSASFKDNNSFAMVFPIGVGVKLNFIPRISFGAELGVRYVLSDTIDGLSTDNSQYNDIYYLFNFKVFYRFPRAKKLKGLTN